jgi:Ser/Thr protein kinase RdoA (MazF antagonist)
LPRRGQIRLLRHAAESALQRFGIEPLSLSLLDHAFNTTFLAVGQDGERYVLHLLLSEEGGLPEEQRRARAESELWWVDRVRERLDLRVPVPVRTPHGAGVVAVDVEGMARPLLCTLFCWVEGRMNLHRLTPAHLEAVGRVTALLHRNSVHLRVPDWFDRSRVDAADAEIEEEVARRFAGDFSAEAAEVMRRALRRARAAQQELGGDPETFGLIHADIHQRNYLFHGHEVRLIDFGDCGWGHYLYDFGVTLSELKDRPRYGRLRGALIAGYRQMRDLPPAHESLIDAFIALRRVQDLSWFLKERDNPAYTQWTSRIGQGIAELEQLLDDHPAAHRC